MNETVYLVFGDLHGRILPAFKLAAAWARAHETEVVGILQVGDLGYFPDVSRLDKATLRHAKRDPLELGAQLVAEPSKEADAVFADPDTPPVLWFTAGNHEDFEALAHWQSGAGPHATDFAVDAYVRVRAIADGKVAQLPGGLRVGALWGIDADGRKKLPPRACIRERSARSLNYDKFDVLLTHDSPADAVYAESGSELIDDILLGARPRFAFFGHYGVDGQEIDLGLESTGVFHVAGFELRHHKLYPEKGSVGVLRWGKDNTSFEFIDHAWLMNFPRTDWRHW